MKRLTLGLCLGLFLSAGNTAAATLTVNAGGDLQAAINAALPGDTILLAAGAVFTGTYMLPVKGGSSYVTIRSAASDGSLPAAGARIGPAYAGLLPKIRSTQNGPAFKTAGAAAYWRLMFLEILPSTTASSTNLVELGGSGASQSSLASVPHHLVIDRCYIHGNPGYTQRRGISLNSAETQILNSYISEIKDPVNDAQAIAGWNGPGPYLIENNYVEGSGENIMFGGSDPSIPNLVPSNITIRRNLITKPLAWMTQGWVVKNLIELKSADTVLIEGNTIENNWAAAQQGYSILFTPRNQDGTAPSTVVQNVTFQHNIVRHVAAVFSISGYDNNWPSRQTNHIVIRNNLVYDVSTAYAYGGALANAWFAIIGYGPRDITFDHNTIDSSGGDTFLFYEGPTASTTPIYGVTLTNNLLRDNAYGIMGSGTQEGSGSLAAYAPGAIVLRNAIGGADPRFYPAGNDYPSMAQWVAGFVNAAAADYRLAPTSLSRSASTDGTDIGVNFTTLNAAMTGTPTVPPTTPPEPPGPTTPTPFTGTAIALPGTIEVENYDKGGDGVAYHDTTAGNNPGAYRTDDVDIRVTADSSGSYNVKGVRAGEWLAYTVNVAAAGSYAFGFRIASSGTGGTVHLTVDGADVSGAIALPDTGGWGSWQTATRTGVTLPAGTHLLKFIVDANGSAGAAADINWISVTSTPTNPSMAYSGTPVALPGRVEAENYDKGGEGAAYHDLTTGNSTGAYRNDDVDIRVGTDAGGGYNIKSVRAGEWLGYSVNIPAAGTYAIDLRAASAGPGGTVHLAVDGTDVTGPIVVPNTGGWDTWATVTKTGVALPAGVHVIRFVIDANGSTGTAADVNWFAVR